jgi:hypothetical protein
MTRSDIPQTPHKGILITVTAKVKPSHSWWQVLAASFVTSLHRIYRRGEMSDGKAEPYAHDGLKLFGVRASSRAPSHQFSSSVAYPLGYKPQIVSEPHQGNQHKTRQLPSIYSGIGVGVYQGEAVILLKMAVGERRWIVSKLRPQDLAQFPSSLQQEASLLPCVLHFLCLENTQSDSAKRDSQKLNGIESMRNHCPLAHNQPTSQTSVGDESTNATQTMQEAQILKNRCHQLCSVWSKMCPCTTQSSIEKTAGQFAGTENSQ